MNILAISDLHAPFQHQDAIEFLIHLKKIFKPKLIICQGDEIDGHAISEKWNSDPDGWSPGHEIDAAVSALKEVYEIFPKVSVCISNHTARPYIKAFNSGLPRRFLKEYCDSLEAPIDWKWADYWIYENIRFEHGIGYSGATAALSAAIKNRMSTSIGHVHSHAGIQYSASSKDLIFGLNTGCLFDHKKYAGAYAKFLANKPVLGSGVIINGIPHFIPMILSKNGRWLRRLI